MAMNWSGSILLGTLVVFMVVSFQNVAFVSAQVAEKSCKQVMSDLTKRQLQGLATCTKTLKFKNSKEKSKKMNCIMKCGMENESMISKTGTIDAAQVDILIMKNFPPSLIDRVNATFIPCIEKGAGMDPNPETDPFCLTYDPLIKCLIGAFPNLCTGMP